jgi:hypothetical protein
MLQGILVGAIGFEPTTPCAQGRCATRLRYAPTRKALLILNHFRELSHRWNSNLCPIWCATVPKLCQNPSIDSRCVITEAHGAALIYILLVRMAIEFDQSLAFHLQFHLGVLFENLRVPLPQ